MKILNLGSLNIDRVYNLDHFVKAGETLSSTGFELHSGGKGLNQAIACKKAGSDVYFAGKIGNDGLFLNDVLKDSGVNTDYLIVDEDHDTGHSVIQVESGGQNCIILWGGTNHLITHEDVDSILSHFEKGDILLLQNEISSMDYIIDKGYEKGMVIALNPSPLDDKLLAANLEKVSYFIMNEIEAEQISGHSDPDKAIEQLKAKYPDSKFVVTLGSAGVKYYDGENVYRHGIYDVKAVDTTAAGDTFTGYFLNGLLEGKDPMDILAMASKASAIAVSRPGSGDSVPFKDEVVARDLKLK